MTPILLAAMLFSAEPKKPVQKIDFEPDTIGGLRDGPDGDIVTHRNRPDFKSLIKVRENFADKIVRSVDQM